MFSKPSTFPAFLLFLFTVQIHSVYLSLPNCHRMCQRVFKYLHFTDNFVTKVQQHFNCFFFVILIAFQSIPVVKRFFWNKPAKMRQNRLKMLATAPMHVKWCNATKSVRSLNQNGQQYKKKHHNTGTTTNQPRTKNRKRFWWIRKLVRSLDFYFSLLCRAYKQWLIPLVLGILATIIYRYLFL